MNFWSAVHKALDFLFCDRCILMYHSTAMKFCPIQPLWNIVGDATDPRGRLRTIPNLFPRRIMKA